MRYRSGPNEPDTSVNAMKGQTIHHKLGCYRPMLWCRAQREAEASGGKDMKQILAELAPYQTEVLLAMDDAPLFPVMPLRIAKRGMNISLFTVVATFGTAQDVTAEELRIESLFPGDEATERLIHRSGFWQRSTIKASAPAVLTAY